MFLLLLWKAFFFSCQHVGTLWLGCMRYGLGIETTESHGWKSSSLRFT